MKNLLFAAVCTLLILLNAPGHVESRPHGDRDSDPQYKLFVFGDDYADTGNYPLADLSKTTRAWYYPYGSNDKDHGMSASGRFSNGLVLPDFIARILGLDESPPAEKNREQDGVDPSGMNFAVGGAGVVEGTHEAPKLGTQVDKFKRLVKHNIIDKDLTDSVALIAFSGKRDYARVSEMSSSQITAKAQDVTDKIADAVEQLLDVGVEKVLVTTLPPLGCTPWLARSSDYSSSCDAQKVASVHNAYLEEKVFKDDGDVFNLDLNMMFKRLTSGSGGSSQSKKFKHKLDPCCEIFDDKSEYCGQMEDGVAAYVLCSTPDKYFYWDDINPTHAGWKAVVNGLEESINNFL